jgi:hypothetical protein
MRNTNLLALAAALILAGVWAWANSIGTKAGAPTDDQIAPFQTMVGAPRTIPRRSTDDGEPRKRVSPSRIGQDRPNLS